MRKILSSVVLIVCAWCAGMTSPVAHADSALDELGLPNTAGLGCLGEYFIGKYNCYLEHQKIISLGQRAYEVCEHNCTKSGDPLHGSVSACTEQCRQTFIVNVETAAREKQKECDEQVEQVYAACKASTPIESGEIDIGPGA